MADIVDRAQAREAEILADALGRAMRALPSGVSAQACEDCGDEIPEKRRLALPGCQRCVYCQEERERRARTQERT